MVTGKEPRQRVLCESRLKGVGLRPRSKGSVAVNCLKQRNDMIRFAFEMHDDLKRSRRMVLLSVCVENLIYTVNLPSDGKITRVIWICLIFGKQQKV